MSNDGIAILNDAPCGPFATIAATGVGRSGTTMLARVMQAIGIDMGEALSTRTVEDKTIIRAMKAGDGAAFEAHCRRRDASAAIWGFKAPALRNNMPHYATLMRNPRFIVIFRDILAISIRNNISIGFNLLEGMRKTASNYVNMIEHVSKLESPVLLISYEKTLQFPARTVTEIATFCDRAVTAQGADRIASETIRNGDLRYLS